MSQVYYNKIVSKIAEDQRIRYGIVYGNEKIVFIKVGADRTIRGHQDKYIQIARRVHARLGATVICASNPDVGYDAQEAADKAMIAKVAADCGFAEYEVHFVGTSDGGYQILRLAQQVAQTKKILGINPSLISKEDLTAQLQKLPQVEKCLIFGAKDEAVDCVPFLQQQACSNLEIRIVEGANHEFKGMVDRFIELIDLV